MSDTQRQQENKMFPCLPNVCSSIFKSAALLDANNHFINRCHSIKIQIVTLQNASLFNGQELLSAINVLSSMFANVSMLTAMLTCGYLD